MSDTYAIRKECLINALKGAWHEGFNAWSGVKAERATEFAHEAADDMLRDATPINTTITDKQVERAARVLAEYQYSDDYPYGTDPAISLWLDHNWKGHESQARAALEAALKGDGE